MHQLRVDVHDRLARPCTRYEVREALVQAVNSNAFPDESAAQSRDVRCCAFPRLTACSSFARFAIFTARSTWPRCLDMKRRLHTYAWLQLNRFQVVPWLLISPQDGVGNNMEVGRKKQR